MDQYVTGAVIKALREKAKLTQAQLAEKLNVSDKAVSKWETGRGYPDVTLLEPLAAVFRVSVAELLSGKAVTNTNISANMRRSHFYICPVCGNILHSMGQAAVSCHGIALPPLEAEEPDASHTMTVEAVEDEYFVSVRHEMSRTHYISFLAAVSDDRLQLIRLYPEGNAEARIQRRGVQSIYACCNRDGLFKLTVK
ncbi:MAG: helix-turn-helix domain-containing protein [Vescimonas sp.]